MRILRSRTKPNLLSSYPCCCPKVGAVFVDAKLWPKAGADVAGVPKGDPKPIAVRLAKQIDRLKFELL